MTDRALGARSWLALLAAAAAISALPALAQQEAVERCRAAASDEARIACLEAALAGDHGDEDGAEPAPPSTEPAALRPALPESTDRTAAREPLNPASRTADDLGAEQLRSRNRTPEERAEELEAASGLRVARYGTVPFRRLQVYLENGQVWRQIQGDTQRLRVDLDRNQTVDITESSLGGYRLRLNEMRRTIRVERVQ